MKLAHITTKAQALTALRKLGWAKSLLQLTRGATSYMLATQPDGPMITLSSHGHMVTCAGEWGSVSALRNIENTADGAAQGECAQLARLVSLGIVDANEASKLSTFALAVAIGAALAKEASQTKG